MNIVKLCTYCLGGVLLSTASMGMKEIEPNDLAKVYCAEQTVVVGKCTDNRQIRAQYRKGTNDECSQSTLDYEFINYMQKQGIWINYCTRSSAAGNEEGKNLRRKATYEKMNNWLNHRFPTGENEEEMKERYDAYTFSYTLGPCNSLKMDIASNNGEKSTSVILDKHGWVTLVNMDGTIYSPSDLYYLDGNIGIRGSI